MRSALHELLESRLPLPGVAAWCARLPDRTFVRGTYSDWFKQDRLDEIVTRLIISSDGLAHHGIQPLRLSWAFEHARIQMAVRQEGPCLAFFLENRAGLPTDKIEGIFADFAALPVEPAA